MASDEYSGAPCVQQPGLRSFIVYSRAPDGTFVREVLDDANEPHLREGDFVAIDPADREPIVGELYLFESTSYRQDDPGRLKIIQATWNDGWKGWMIAATNRLFDIPSVNGVVMEKIRFFDGPYTDEMLSQKIIGRVVGIVEPDFRLMLTRG